MNISSINFNQNYSSHLNKISNNSNKTPSFKGNENKAQLPSGEQFSAYIHPALALQIELLNDGYTMEEIKNSHVFDIIKIGNIDFSDPNLVEKAQSGEIKTKDVVSHSTKKNADILAIQTGYHLLKQKFNSSDVQAHIEEMRKFEDDLNATLIKLGHQRKANRTSVKSMILSALHYVDSKNVNLLNELLDDENFNNIYINTALMKLDKNKDMKYAHQALQMGQEAGYEKEFSFPLAIMISEANESNMPLIEKMLTEQEFLSDNSDFVSNKMMSFLRGWEPGLAISYLSDDDLTLREIEELMDNSFDEE